LRLAEPIFKRRILFLPLLCQILAGRFAFDNFFNRFPFMTASGVFDTFPWPQFTSAARRDISVASKTKKRQSPVGAVYSAPDGAKSKSTANYIDSAPDGAVVADALSSSRPSRPSRDDLEKIRAGTEAGLFFSLLRRLTGFAGLFDFGNGFGDFGGFDNFPFRRRRRDDWSNRRCLDIFNGGDEGTVGGNPKFAPDGGVGGIVKRPFAIHRELHNAAAVVNAVDQGGHGDVALGLVGLR
jgi:hypothetical protein